MIITLRPEHEQVIDQAIAAGLIANADQVVEVGLDALRRRMEARTPSAPITAEQWEHELHQWISSHSTTTPLLSAEAISRESIYRERGL